MAYGMDRSRYHENKRAVEDKDLGPLVETWMTRCIHCTRCIRFATEVAGVPELGATGRGEHMEVGTYVEKVLTSELSGNIIDLCPVGALTSKPYAYMARSWELKKTESIDVMDALGSHIRVDARGPEVMRVMPRLNEDINEEWISDKTRFACDGLRNQRLDTPYVRKDGKLKPATWEEALAAAAAKLTGTSASKIAAVAGDLADCESMYALKALMEQLGSKNLDCRQDGAQIDPSCRAGYLFNSTIAGIEQADALLLIGTDPRKEAPVLNARIRKRFLTGKLKIAAIGPRADLTYPYEHLGEGPASLKAMVAGELAFAKTLKSADRPMLILGQGALARPDGAAVLTLAHHIADDFGLIKDGWNGFNVLHTSAARVGGLDLGFVPGAGGKDVAGIVAGAAKGDIEVLYLLGADEIDMNGLGKAFVIYQGHHGDAGAHRADVILPGAAYTEKDATYVNTEGRVQRAAKAVFPPGDAREDWAIVRALSGTMGRPLPFDSLDQVRAAMRANNPAFAAVGVVAPAAWGRFGQAGETEDKPFRSPIRDFYRTDPISRASITMAECSALFNAPKGKTGTDG